VISSVVVVFVVVTGAIREAYVGATHTTGMSRAMAGFWIGPNESLRQTDRTSIPHFQRSEERRFEAKRGTHDPRGERRA
jgi:hypothetical protein